jgi:hypothetical protein
VGGASQPMIRSLSCCAWSNASSEQSGVRLSFSIAAAQSWHVCTTWLKIHRDARDCRPPCKEDCSDRKKSCKRSPDINRLCCLIGNHNIEPCCCCSSSQLVHHHRCTKSYKSKSFAPKFESSFLRLKSSLSSYGCRLTASWPSNCAAVSH